LLDFRSAQENDSSRLAIHERLYDAGLSREYAYVVLDWGYYHLQWVFGDKNQMVVGCEGISRPDEVAALKKLLRDHGRKALFIAEAPNSKADLALLSREFRLVKLPGLPEDARWQVLMEPRS
jgi:hypothetical protein